MKTCENPGTIEWGHSGCLDLQAALCIKQRLCYGNLMRNCNWNGRLVADARETNKEQSEGGYGLRYFS